MKKQLLTAILICGASVLTSYSNDDKPTGQQDEYAGVPLIILDTDIGSSADDLFALEMLYHYEDGTEGTLSVLMTNAAQTGLVGDFVNAGSLNVGGYSISKFSLQVSQISPPIQALGYSSVVNGNIWTVTKNQQ